MPLPGKRFSSRQANTDMAENIIHLVLAKAPGGGRGDPRASRSFIVPKNPLFNEGLAVGRAQCSSVANIEEKSMAIHPGPNA